MRPFYMYQTVITLWKCFLMQSLSSTSPLRPAPEFVEAASRKAAAVPARDKSEDAAASNAKPPGFVELWMQMAQLLKNVFRTAVGPK